MNKKKKISCCRAFREQRTRTLGEADVLKPEEVACALSKNRNSVHQWLVENGLIRMVLGSQRVIWGEVLQIIRKRKTISPKNQLEHQIEIPLTDEF